MTPDYAVVRIDALNFDPANARKHPEKNLTAIKGSLAKFGQQKPIIVTRAGIVIAGNGTLAAAKALGWEQIQVRYTDLSGPEAMAFALADNRTAELAEWDLEILGSQLHALAADGFGIADIGFDPGDWLKQDKSKSSFDESKEDDVPETAPARVQRGQIWQLGKHRLMCGDSTMTADTDRLMAGAPRIGMCFTSPPYNADDGKYQGYSDDLGDDEFTEFLGKFTDIALDRCDFVFVNIQLLARNRISLIDFQSRFKRQLKDILIWNKKQCPPNIVKGAFNTKFEFVYALSRDHAKSRGFPVDWQGKFPNVVETESNSGNEFAAQHKAGFPIAFPSWFIEKFEFAQTVYEPFCGTGTTLVACEKFGRICYGMELNPTYCDIIIERWEKVTGQTASLLTGQDQGVAA